VSTLDAGRLIAALVLSVTALFLVAGRLRGRYGRMMRWIAVAGYAVALALALAQIGRWLIG
jgi:hypothetical protein